MIPLPVILNGTKCSEESRSGKNMEMTQYKLSDIGEVCMCKRILKSETNSDGGIPFFKIGTFGNIADVYIEKEKFEEYKSKYSYPKKGEILISAAGTIGRLVVYNGEDAYFQDSNIVWIDNDESKVLNQYLYYCYQGITWKVSTGSTILRLYNDDIRNTVIRVPSLPEQKKIAAVLSALDEKIALNKKMNQKLEAMAKRLYDYWFVQFDFPDENGRPYKTSGGPMTHNPTLNREIPEGWDVKKICDLSVFEKESTRPSSNPNVLYKHFSIPGFDECGSYVFEKGCDILSDKFIVTDSSILVSKLNPWTSRVVWGENLEDSICSTEFVVMKLNSLCEKGFLYMLVKQPSFIDYCTRGSSGTSHSHRRVNPEFMMNFMFAYNESIVRKFSAIASQYAQMIVKNLRENRRLSALRDKLLPLLMNGQVEAKNEMHF